MIEGHVAPGFEGVRDAFAAGFERTDDLREVGAAVAVVHRGEVVASLWGGMADAATVLFTQHLKFDPAAPDWADRDRFVLSAGHGSMLIYSLLYLTGYAAPTIDDIRNFRKLGSPCAGHPENFLLDGVECTTGPLGQGLAMAVGLAMAERHLNAVYGDDLVDHRTWVIAGDGCLMEGINHEAIGLAGHLKLGRLNVLWDDNRITIDGATDLSTSLVGTGFGYDARRRAWQAAVLAHVLPQVRDIMNEEFEKMLAGDQTAQQALDNAVSRGNKAIQEALGN